MTKNKRFIKAGEECAHCISAYTEGAEGMLQSCDQSAGCRDTEKVHGATIAHCSACFHCNTTSNSHTVWGRRLVVTRSEDRSGMTQHRSLQRRIWPNTCLHPSRSSQPLDFTGAFPRAVSGFQRLFTFINPKDRNGGGGNPE